MNTLRYKFKNITKRCLIACLIVFFIACSGGDGGGDDPTPPVVDNPTAATLVFPESNSECTEGTNITSAESTIEFRWNAGLHTNTYNLQLKNLDNGNTTGYSTSDTKLSLKLSRGTPYSWYIVSRSNQTSNTAQSPTWKFYNAGEGVSSYAPFPAEAISPAIGADVANGSITLEWSGSDADNDIESYDVYFGEASPPSEYKTGITETTLDNVIIEAGKIYYWSVSTTDEQGNISMSDTFSFKGI